MRAAIYVMVVLAACSASRGDRVNAEASTAAASATMGGEADVGEFDSVAYFAGGCFWGVEYYLEQLDGVVSVESGYMGGHVDSPSYEQVSSRTSGHLETVLVRFDSTRVSYEAIARRFFEIHDPTQADGQGPDIGPEYRSAVFFTSPEQEQTTRELIELLRTRGYEVVTEVRPAETFWPAEQYHQDHYSRGGGTPYCHTRVRRF